jgi:hypothetical protein
MSVKFIYRQDIIKLVDNDEQPLAFTTPAKKKNFYNVFGTTGCLLNCENERIVEQTLRYDKTEHVEYKRERERVARKQHRAESRISRREWFSARELAQSVEQGCGSCSVLSKIILNIFPVCGELSSAYEYSVSHEFELRRRLSSGEGKVEIVQLFQPPGT